MADGDEADTGVASVPPAEQAGPPSPAQAAQGVTEAEREARRQRGRGDYGCRHYRRRVRFITPCCNEKWDCRHCHNEVKYQQQGDWSKKHELDRKRITQVVCALCDTPQPVGVECVACGVSFGAYSCTKCPFYDDDGLSKQTYHCDDCGICRVGGRENFFHCATCGSCYAANLRNNHVCVERAMHQNCPVCFEFLFESVDPTTVLRCGHTIHSQCLRELERNTAAICPCCPICKKSLGDYSRFWKAVDREVASAGVPPEYRGWTTNILCNDCSSSSTVAFSLIAHKCGSCGSYNTRRMGINTVTGSVLPAHEAEAAGAAGPPGEQAAAGAEGLVAAEPGAGAVLGAEGEAAAAQAAQAAVHLQQAIQQLDPELLLGEEFEEEDEEDEWEDAEDAEGEAGQQ